MTAIDVRAHAGTSPEEAFRQKKIRMAISGMKIAILMPTTAILMNIANQYVTDAVYSTLADKVILSIICSITLICMADFFGGVFTVIFNLFKGKGLTEYKRTAGVKVSWMMLLSAAAAGPLATGCWMAATPFCGLTPVAVVTSLNPILVALAGSIFLRETLSKRVYLGIVLAVVGVIVAGWTGVSEGGSNFLLGAGLAFLAPIGFTLEAQFSTYAGDIIDPMVGCGMYRCFGSFVIGLAAMALLSFFTGNFDSYLLIINAVLTSPTLFIAVVIMGILAGINCNAAYVAFNRTGPSRIMVIDCTRPVLSIPFGYLFAALGIAAYTVSTMEIAGAAILVVGLALILCKPSELLNFRNASE